MFELIKNELAKHIITLSEKIPAMIVCLETGTILVCKEPLSRLFGYHPEDLEGKNISVLIPEEFRGRHLNHLEDYWEDPEARPMLINDRLVEGIKADGSKIPISISLSPLFFRDKPALVVMILKVPSKEREADG